MREIRWHARAGQGAKSASQLYAVAELKAGRSVQAFPEYGPERRGAPVRAYTRVDDRPVRRHDAVNSPDVVVVLDPSLLRNGSGGVLEGLKPDGLVLVNSEDDVPADRIAAEVGTKFVNLVMVGALAGRLNEPSLDQLVDGAVSVLGKKVPPEQLRAALTAGWEATCR